MKVARRSPTDPAAHYLLLGAALALAGFGLVMVFSASTPAGLLSRSHDAFLFARRQATWFLIGLAALGLCSRVDYRRFGRLPEILWWAAMALLVSVWVPGLGKTVNGATRWIDIGTVTIQPSEIAKLIVLVCFAQELAGHRGEKLTLSELAHPFGRWVFAPFFIVILQRDLGTAMTLLFGPLVVTFIVGLRFLDLAAMGIGVTGLIGLAIKLEPFRVRRLTAFLDPWADPKNTGYQAIQALLAFGAGGWTGAGLGAGRQKFMYLPAAQTDFIFAIIGEELGLIGALAVVLGFAVLSYAGMRIAIKAKDPFGRALAGGIVGSIAFQAILNMAAVTSLAPITGIPLPLISYGGWALVMTMAGVGLVLSVGCPHRREATREDRGERRRDGRARVSGDRPRLCAVESARSA